MFAKALSSVSRDDIAGILQYTRRGHGNCTETADFSDARVLHAFFDTVESYYKGNFKSAKLEHLQRLFEREKDRGKFDPIVTVAGRDWVMRPGGRSNYRWSLTNKKLGLQVYFSHAKYDVEDTTPSQVKVIASPHFLHAHTDQEAVEFYDELAFIFLENPKRSACGAHLCVDVMGIELDEDYASRMQCHSKAQRTRDGAFSMAFQGSNTILKYKGIQSVTFGTRAYQLQVYDKSQWALEASRTHYWASIWAKNLRERYCEEWEPGRKVWRFELRISHAVLKEMERGSEIDLSDQIEVAKAAKNLWLAGLNNFRLDADTVYVDPLWQFLAEEVGGFTMMPGVEILRHYAQTAGMPYERVLKLAVAYCVKTWVAQHQGLDAIHMNLLMTGLWQPFVCAVGDPADAHRALKERYDRLVIEGHGMTYGAGAPDDTWDERLH